MRSTSQSFMLKVGIIGFAFVVCVGATAIHAWQGRDAEAAMANDTTSYIWALRNSAHLDNLPIRPAED